MEKNKILNIFYIEEEERNKEVDALARNILRIKNKLNFLYYNTWFNEENNKKYHSIIIELSEINRNIEEFKDELSISLIKDLNDIIIEKHSCNYCGTITLNRIPYTYRDNGGCIGKSFECPYCSYLKYSTIIKIRKIKEEKGNKEAAKEVIKILTTNNQ